MIGPLSKQQAPLRAIKLAYIVVVGLFQTNRYLNERSPDPVAIGN